MKYLFIFYLQHRNKHREYLSFKHNVLIGWWLSHLMHKKLWINLFFRDQRSLCPIIACLSTLTERGDQKADSFCVKCSLCHWVDILFGIIIQTAEMMFSSFSKVSSFLKINMHSKLRNLRASINLKIFCPPNLRLS